MAQRRHHYEHAFEAYLRERRVPYVAVDEARKALIPHCHPHPHGEAPRESRPAKDDQADASQEAALKSFDFVIYGQGSNLLIEVKGRRIGRRACSGVEGRVAAPRMGAAGRLETWVTLDDIESLSAWGQLFGPEFAAAFVFVYWCDEQPPDALFEEIFEHRGKWYALRAITLADYVTAMRVRSLRWRTVHMPSAAFNRLSHSFSPSAFLSRQVGAGASVAGASTAMVDPPPGPPLLDPW